jgi:hypothetical protein
MLRTVVAAGGAFQFLEVAGWHGTVPVRAVEIAQEFFQRENLCFGDKQANLAVIAAPSIAIAGFQQRLADNIKIKTERRMSLFSVFAECAFRYKFMANDLYCPRYMMVGLAVDDEWIERGSRHPHIAQGSARKVKRRVN